MNGNASAGDSSFCDSDCFHRQENMGLFGGSANSHRLRDRIDAADAVVDFGCGGFPSSGLQCQGQIGIGRNPSAQESAISFCISRLPSPREALGEPVDPERLPKIGGSIHFVPPCDSIPHKFDPADLNKHRLGWSAANFGSLFARAGYQVEFSIPYTHEWPASYRQIAQLGWPVFNLACRIHRRMERTWLQIELPAKRP